MERLLKNANLQQNGPKRKILYGKRHCLAWATQPQSFGVIEFSSLQQFRLAKRKSLQSLTMHPDLMTITSSHKCTASLSFAWTESQEKFSGRPHAKKSSLTREDM
tara:strand:- start:868 stop:1182 length:315 start_codon:yes stop_codon:yes gene_type:complete